MLARALVVVAIAGCDPVRDVEVDAQPQIPTGTCPGLEIRRDVLANASFESTPCAPNTVASWEVVKSSAGWVGASGRPLISDNAGCGVTNFGCDATWLTGFPNIGIGCLAIWGVAATAMGEWVEVRQRYQAPREIQKIALAYARGSDQLEYDWEYDLAYEISGVRVVVDTVVGNKTTAKDPMGRFESEVKDVANPNTDLTVSIRLRRVGPQAGNVWVFVDDVNVDVCY